MSKITYTVFNDHSQVRTFPANLTFKVYYLEAILSIFGGVEQIGPLGDLISVNAFHSGVGFQCTDKNNPYEFTLDMIVKDGFTLTSILPEIVDGELVWNNQGANTIGSFIDRSYWERSTYVCTITSAQVTDIMRWTLDTWQPKNPIYSLFYGIPDMQDIFNPTFRPAFCDNYAYSIFFYIQDQNGGQFTDPVNIGQGFGVCIDYATVPNVTACAFVSENMVAIDYETHKGAIVGFYIELEAALNQIIIDGKSLAEIIQEIRENPGNIELILEAEKLLFEILLELYLIYTEFDLVYYYGYDANNNPTYWEITNPTILLDYIDSNLQRSFAAKDINGSTVNDGFTCATCSNCVDYEQEYNRSLILIIIILTVLIIATILFWIIYLIYRG